MSSSLLIELTSSLQSYFWSHQMKIQDWNTRWRSGKGKEKDEKEKDEKEKDEKEKDEKEKDEKEYSRTGIKGVWK